jgi:hypothetical protein
LVPLLKTLLRISTWTSVPPRSLPLELPLLGVHLLVLIINYNVEFLVKSGKVNTGAVVNLFFSSLKLAWHLSDHINLAFFSNRAVIGLASLENPSINLL